MSDSSEKIRPMQNTPPLFLRQSVALTGVTGCFFVFAGNIGVIPQVRQLLGGWLKGNALLTAVASSQVISNVPASVLLSGFTENWKCLLAGTNLGGLGTLIASLASLISFKFYIRVPGAKPLRYLGVFTLLNILGLLVLVPPAFLIV